MNDKKVALVTGAMGGLGEAIARRLYLSGCTVAASFSPSNDHAEQWLAQQQEQGFRFQAFQADVGDPASCAALVREVGAELGPVAVLVNNAGITRDQSLRKMTAEEWRMVLRTNLDSVFNMCKPALDMMLEQKWGRIINIASVNGQKGAFGQTNYCAAKAGMHGFTKALALEVARHGITVNTVSPGYLRTAMVAKVPDDILKDKILPQIPLGRLGEPYEVAALVAYLASEEAAFVTGAEIAINGGQHMR